MQQIVQYEAGREQKIKKSQTPAMIRRWYRVFPHSL